MRQKMRTILTLITLMILSYFLLILSGRKPIEKEHSISIPVTANFVVALKDLSTAKQFTLNELYSNKGSELIKALANIKIDTTDFESSDKSDFIEFFSALNIGSTTPLEFLQLELNNETLSFLRIKGKTAKKGSALLASKDGYIYLLLDQTDLEKKELLSAINQTVKIKNIDAGNFLSLYLKSNNKWSLSASIILNKKKISLKFFNPKNTKHKTLSLEPKGLHISIPNSEYKSLETSLFGLHIKHLSGNFLGWEDNKIIMPVFDLVFNMEENISIDTMVSNLSKVIERFVPQKENYKWSTGEANSFHLTMFDQFKLYFRKVNNETWFVTSIEKKAPKIVEISSEFQLKGDPSVILDFENLGWKGRLISEYLEGSFALRIMKTLILNLDSIQTINEFDFTKVDLNLKGNQELTGFLHRVLINEIKSHKTK